MDSAQPTDAMAAAELARAYASPRLRRRRFALLPLTGTGSAFTEAQGRSPGDSSAPEDLADLISSISEIGVLQAILAEEIPAEDPASPPTLRVVTGERRLRACRWGAVHLPQNPHFDALPAVICPGPLSEEERRIWQLVENLARDPLRPGEQAAALLYQRCAVLTGKLLRGGIPVPHDVHTLADPAERFRALERLRGSDPKLAAPWSEVLARLGLQLAPRQARELVRAFAALPRELSEEMDEQRVALHTRIRFAALRRGREDAADEIWAAVKEHHRTDLLYSASGALLKTPDLPPADALEAADAAALEARAVRAAALRRAPDTAVDLDADVDADPDPQPEETDPGDAEPAGGSETDQPAEPAHPATLPQPASADPALVRGALTGLRALIDELRGGRVLGRYDRGSLRLLAEELDHALSRPATT